MGRAVCEGTSNSPTSLDSSESRGKGERFLEQVRTFFGLFRRRKEEDSSLIYTVGPGGCKSWHGNINTSMTRTEYSAYSVSPDDAKDWPFIDDME